jgi:hypothetical protein
MLLAEVGGIAQAAEKLHLSVPAVHKQLKLMESEQGVRLNEWLAGNFASPKRQKSCSPT